MDLVDVKKLIEFKKSKAVGSYCDSNILFPSDIDLNELIITSKSPEYFAGWFQRLFVKAYKNKNIWITDLKCGEDSKGEPIRWSRDDMKKGYQDVDGKRFTFEDCLRSKSIIKMDVFALVKDDSVNDPDTFIQELSINYIFDFKKEKFRTQDKVTVEEIIKNMKQDLNELQRQGLKYKSLKRQYRISKLEGNDRQDLVELFNSEIGFQYHLISRLKSLKILADNEFRHVKKSIILDEIEEIVCQIPKEITREVKINSRNKPLDTIIFKTEKLIDLYEKVLNKRLQEILE